MDDDEKQKERDDDEKQKERWTMKSRGAYLDRSHGGALRSTEELDEIVLVVGTERVEASQFRG
jgi:hypothetical protein